MSELGVWAPVASRVEVVTARERRALLAGDDGWWRLPPPGLPPDTDYRFSLDGGEPLPDPRSPYQPAGVHGPSRTVDHEAFPWTDRGFVAPPLESAIVYELHVGTFSPEGTFDGVIPRLEHLVELGVSHLSLMPVNQFPGSRGWGYDGVGLFAVQASYGGPMGLKRLVDACHARGLGVLLDVVYNHLGPDGNVLDRYGPYFTDQYSTFWGPALNLDQAGSDQVRRFVCDNAAMWIRDYHLDGLRLDAVHALFDRSAVPLLEQLSAELAELGQSGRRPVLIAESDLNDPRLLRPREAGGLGLDAQWSDDLHHALHAVLTGERAGYYVDFGTMAQLARALTDAYVFQGEHSPHRRRRHGRPPQGVARSAFLGYLQTHDQIGNRACGERIGQLVAAAARVRVGAGLVLTSPSVPMLFMGEEWGASTPFLYFTDHSRPGLADLVREGRRAEFAAFGWLPDQVPDPNEPTTFARSQLRWEELDAVEPAAMLAWYRALIALRRQRVVLREPYTAARFDEGGQWLALDRPTAVVCANLGASEQALEVGPGAEPWLVSSDGVRLDGSRIRLPPDGFAVVGRPSAGPR